MIETHVLAGKRVEAGDLLVAERRRNGMLTGRVKKAPKRRTQEPVLGIAISSSVQCDEGHLVMFRTAP